jgi:UDP-N-acetylglucosamine--N-acetylmuramyl-(pentapeptide) pyrophosphoryl-undecaprenol N-acetylglucosamine transferase
MMLRVILTGGGTAGHVNPNLALMEVLQSKGCELFYVGSEAGVERAMTTARNIPYYAVRSGKLRRYLSWKNLSDPFNVVMGVVQSFLLLRRLKPDVVFSKGGFVALPVVVGAWLNRIPVIAHESDFTPGLANRLSLPFVDTLCVNFSGTLTSMKQPSKVQVTGTPIRAELLNGSRAQGLSRCGFDDRKPCLLVMGGSQGARALNACIREALPRLRGEFQVIHLCGKGNLDASLNDDSGYCQFEYVDEGLGDLLAATAIVVSRAGANALCEILACGKPHVLVPLSRRSSRGDQIENAHYFSAQGISVVVEEEHLTPDALIAALGQVQQSYDVIREKIAALQITSATQIIADLILKRAHHDF